MRVPKRKPGQYANTPFDPHMTPKAIEGLKFELEKLEKWVLPKLLEEMQHAASHGDFSENAAYQIAKGRVRGTNDAILRLKKKISLAIPIIRTTSSQRVELGSTVTVECNGKQKIYQILGAEETNPGEGKISHLSPLGAILMNKKSGEIVTLDTGAKKNEYKIIKIA